MAKSSSSTWLGHRVLVARCALVLCLLLQGQGSRGDTTTAGDMTDEPTTYSREFTTRVDPGLMSVDYIIIGVASLAIAGALTLLTVVVVMNRNKSKEKNKVLPSNDTLEVRQEEENAIIISQSGAEEGMMEDDPMG